VDEGSLQKEKVSNPGISEKLMFTLTIEDQGFTQKLQAIAYKDRVPTEVMKEVGQMTIDSVKKNFEEQGRPVKWPSSQAADREGRDTLIDSGLLMNSPAISYIAPSFVEVSTGDGLGIYPSVMQFGTQKPRTITDAQRRFFWFKWYEGNESEPWWKSMAIKNKPPILQPFPAREFSMFQEEDVQNISWRIMGWLMEG
jgi:phage gpG-like protein